jgi:hypothetical protein
MKTLKFGDVLALELDTENGNITVDFTVVHVMMGEHYALISQDRLVVVHQFPNGDFIMSEAVDLLDIEPVDYKICKLN